MNDIRVALVVPNKRTRGRGSYKHDLLRRMCYAGEVDLVVFPECFLAGPFSLASDIVKRFSEELRVPLISGVSTDEGFETAGYYNPHHRRGETKNHLYVKHSSADRLAYELEGYTGKADPMFEPIHFKGHRLGVMICHDMFFGLVQVCYLEKGVSCLIDITGGNVQLKKWRSIIQARSIELGGPFYCTMALFHNGQGGKAATIAYHNGVELPPVIKKTHQDGTGGFDIYTISNKEPSGKILITQGYSPNMYSDIRLSLGGSGPADLKVGVARGKVEVKGKSLSGNSSGWYCFNLKVGRTGVLLLSLKDIYSPRKLFDLRPPLGTFDHHIVIYHSSVEPSETDRIMATARLRAIEHRVAVVIFAGEMQEVIKTDNYKHIQRIKPKNNIFGLNARNLGGTHSACKSGIPEEFIRRYLELGAVEN